jgi:ABC-type multidrug transport system fused ATPase/permease subunit
MQMRHSRPSPSGQGSKRTATTRRAPNSQTTSPPVAPRWSTQYRHGVHNSPLRSAGWQLSASRASATAAAPVTAAAPTSTTDRVPRGDTAGAIMLLEDVTVQAGERDLLEGVNWRMMPGQRVGLVGANGAGAHLEWMPSMCDVSTAALTAVAGTYQKQHQR